MIQIKKKVKKNLKNLLKNGTQINLKIYIMIKLNFIKNIAV